MKEVVLHLEGMTCTSCANQIEQELNKLPDTAAVVNYATSTATINTSNVVTIDRYIKKIEDIGYGASVEEVDEDFYLKKVKQQRDFAIVVAIIAFSISMLPQLQFSGWQWFLLVITILLHLFSAIDIHKAAFTAARNRFANMDTLISLGTLVALFVSIYNLIFTQAGMLGMKMSHTFFTRSEGGLYLEVAAVVPAFILAGRYFEAKAKYRNLDAISALKKLSKVLVTVIRDEVEIEVLAKDILPSDLLLVKPGERIVVDGLIVEGQSDIDESVVSGESLPIFRGVGAAVISGSTLIDGFLTIKPLKIGKASVIGQIEQLLLVSQNEKTQTQYLVDKVSRYFVPTILILSLLTFVVWLAAGADPSFALSNALAVLIIACPCALGLATPIAVLVSSAIANSNQILIRSAKSLEVANKVKTIFMDKTGTITEGELEVVDFKVLDNTLTSLDSIIYSLTSKSTHPVSITLSKHHKYLMPTNVENFLQVAGKGVEGEISNTSYKIGSLNWLGVNASEISELAGTRTVGLTRDNKLVAYWRLADRIRPESALAISELQSMNFEVIMLTGDSEQNAKSVAEKVGIKDVRANLSPLDKVAIIERAKSDNKLVAFAGDGLNDVAALSSANLAIAVSGGSYVALAASDITIISGGLEQVVKAIKLARKTLNTIKGNLFWAFAYNSAMIPIAMAGYLQPIWAGAAMALSSTFVVANSLVLRYRKI